MHLTNSNVWMALETKTSCHLHAVRSRVDSSFCFMLASVNSAKTFPLRHLSLSRTSWCRVNSLSLCSVQVICWDTKTVCFQQLRVGNRARKMHIVSGTSEPIREECSTICNATSTSLCMCWNTIDSPNFLSGCSMVRANFLWKLARIMKATLQGKHSRTFKHFDHIFSKSKTNTWKLGLMTDPSPSKKSEKVYACFNHLNSELPLDIWSLWFRASGKCIWPIATSGWLWKPKPAAICMPCEAE